MVMTKRILLLMANDVVLATLALPAAYIIRFNVIPSVDDLLELGIVKVVLFVFTLVFAGYFVEVYRYQRNVANRSIAARIIIALGLSFCILSIIYYTVPYFMYGRGILGIALIVFGTFQFISHTCYRTFEGLKGFAKRILILGTGPLAGQMGSIIPATQSNYILSGYVSCSDEPAFVPSETILEKEGELYETVKR